MRLRNLLVAAAVAVEAGALAAPASAAGRTLYVSPTGSDRARGARTAPLRSIQAALRVARAGDRIVLRGGTYGSFTVSRSGVSVIGAAGQRAVVRASGADRSAITIAGGIGHVTVRHVEVTGVHHFGGGVAGLLVGDGAHDIVLSRLFVTNNWIYGVEVRSGTRVHIDRSTITHNAVGVRFLRGGKGSTVTRSTISTNDRMAIDDATPGNDFGANGVVFQWTTGTITASGNTLANNRAPSHDYVYDGSAFETYGGSDIRMIGNVIYNNPTAYETGTDGQPCDNVVFARNRVWGQGRADLYARGRKTMGIILRCGRNVLIANNTFDRIDDWVFWFDGSNANAGPFGDVRILGNAYLQKTSSSVYAIDMNASQRSGISVDRNALGWIGAPGWPGKLQGYGGLRSFSDLRRLAGFDRRGRQGALRFLNPARHRYIPQAGSIAIDLAPVIRGISAHGYRGSAPDAGAIEGRR